MTQRELDLIRLALRTLGAEFGSAVDPLLKSIESDQRTLADLKTLDDFNPNWQMALAPDGSRYCLPRGDALAFDGATPNEARAEAAAWARKQPR